MERGNHMSEIRKTKKIGIMDVGGGMRDGYGAGVLDYLVGQRDRNRTYYVDYSGRKEYMSWSNVLRSGQYLDLDYIYGTLTNEGGGYPLDYTAMMEKTGTEFVAAVTN